MEKRIIEITKEQKGEMTVAQILANTISTLESELGGSIRLVKEQDWTLEDDKDEHLGWVSFNWAGGPSYHIYRTTSVRVIIVKDTSAPEYHTSYNPENAKKERIWDNLYNDGAEGYNPYR